MKKSVYRIQTSNMDLDIMLDIDRELTDEDNKNFMVHAQNIANSINKETVRLDPKVKEQAAKDKRELLSLFSGNQIFVESVPNEYMSEVYAEHYPWYVVTTPKGRIKIGWRKRVINIDWSDSIIEGNSKDLFPDEDVTRFEKTIHAWGYDKAQEYIDLLLSQSKVVEHV